MPFLVAADLDGKRSGARIRLGAAVDAAEIADVLDDVVEDRRLVWEGDELVERVERRLDALRLGEVRRRPQPGDETTAALVERVRTTRLGVLPWTAATEQLRARMRFLHDTLGEPWPDVSDRALVARLDEWLAPYLAGATGRGDLERLDLGVLLRAQLLWPLGAELDQLAPATWRNRTIDYTADRPTVAVRVQQVFGVTEHPAVGRRARPADDRPALPRRPADPGHRRPARVLGRVVGGGTQGPRRPLPQAPVAGGSVGGDMMVHQ